MINILGYQMNPTIGDIQGNTKKILSFIESNAENADLLVFPELCISGYPPNDLLLNEGFITEQNLAIKSIQALSRQFPEVYIALGIATSNPDVGKPLYNSLAIITKGEIRRIYDKQLLPNDDVFNERRYFEAGKCPLTSLEIKGEKVFFAICEDCWNIDGEKYDYDPLAVLEEDSTLVSINASPAYIEKCWDRVKLFQEIYERHKLKRVVYVNQVGGNDELVFDGASFILTSRSLIRSSLYEEDTVIDNCNGGKTWDYGESLAYHLKKHLIKGIRDYVYKNGFSQVVVGSSGGVDSAVVLCLAQEALGSENVTAITMPSRYSSSGSIYHSEALCANLGVKLYERSIVGDMGEDLDSFQYTFGEPASKLTEENMQARHRGRILFEYSNQTGALVLSTGNKSETAVGYMTLGGDMLAGLNVLGDVYKTEVYKIGELYHHLGKMPKQILTKKPSAELSAGQSDEDSLPPYPILDELLKWHLEDEKVDFDLIKQHLSEEECNNVLKMVAKNEFKRQQSPPIIKCRPKSFGIGRIMPITQKYHPKVDF